MMKKLSLFCILIFFTINFYGQVRSLRGIVRDGSTGHPLSHAHVSVSDREGKIIHGQAITGSQGDFALSGLPAKIVKLQVSYVGYRYLEQEINLNEGNQAELQLILNPSPVPVGEVTVSALRQETMVRNVPLPLTVITDKQLEKIPAVTLSDALKNEPGLAVARDGIWATSANIRGLGEQRLLTIVDGNRIETATDLAAGLALIDVTDIERLEIIRGAASSLYGTGAMGGVINIITKDGFYNDHFQVNGGITGFYQSVNKMHYENAKLIFGDSLWFVRAAATYRNARNVMTPGGELLNSQFTDNNISLKAGFRPFPNHELKVNYQRFFARDAGIPGGNAFPVTATATYSRIYRDMLSAGYSVTDLSEKLKEIEFHFFHQYILRDVTVIPGPTVIMTPSGYHNTNGLQLKTRWDLTENNRLVAGIDLWQRSLQTEREKVVTQIKKDSAGNIISKTVTTRGEVPIPDSKFRSGGIYFQDRFNFMEDRMELSVGGRFDFIHISNDKAVDPLYIIVNDVINDDPPNQRISFQAGETGNVSWSTDVGLLYHLSPEVDLSLSGSRAFRSPSLEERFKYIDLGNVVRIGDPELKPEEGYFTDLGLRIWKDRFHFSSNLFINSMRNLIVEMPGEAYYNYSDQPGRTDTIAALINSNVDKALLHGFDVTTSFNFFDGLTLIGSASFVRGRNTKVDSDLPQIPPFSGRAGIRYLLNGLLGAELYANLTAGQDKIAEGEKATSGYATYDLNLYSAPVTMKKAELNISAGIENITDREYINHLATNRGIVKYEPGRNFFLRIGLGF